jgi:hypothetical protein
MNARFLIATLLLAASLPLAAQESSGAEESKRVTAANAVGSDSKDVSAASAAVTATAFKLPDTPAQSAIKQLPRDVVNAPRARRYSLAEQRDQEERLRLGIDSITVYGQVDPEDFVAKRAPMLAFRDRLDKTPGPMSPAKQTQMVLCFIGLCGLGYGPDGIPVEDKTFSRGELNAKKGLLEQSLQFRGTYQ